MSGILLTLLETLSTKNTTAENTDFFSLIQEFANKKSQETRL